MELGMYFTKASVHEDGTRHWAATITDTLPDNHDERVDMAFFNDAVKKTEIHGMPHLCISHYDFDGKGVPEEIWKAGPTTALFVDGNKFKAKGLFSDSKAGDALFSAVREDMEGNFPYEDRVRISMGFFDETDEEQKSEVTDDGNSRKVYKAGWIKHLAGTRVPVVPRTEIVAWKEMSMTTKKEDAASIVGEELAEELDRYQKQVGKSEAEDLVVKSGEKKKKPKKVDVDFDYPKEEPGKETMAEEMWTETPEEAGVPDLDQEAKRENEAKLKKQKKSKAELVEKIIKDEDGEVVLYSKDGSKVLGRFPYGAGEKYSDKDSAMEAAKKREEQIQFFKHQGKSEAIEKMIKDEGDKVVLYSDEGEVIEEFPYGKDTEYPDKDAAMVEAEKRKQQLEEKCEVVGGEEFEGGDEVVEEAELVEKKDAPSGSSFSQMWESKYGGSVKRCITAVGDRVSDPGAYCAWMKDKALKTTTWRGKKEKAEVMTEDEFEQEIISEFEEEATKKSEVVEKAGRRLKGEKIEEFMSWLDQLNSVVTAGQTFLEWAKQTAAPMEETTGIDMPPENPAIAILEGTPMTLSNFDETMSSFAENVYNAVTEKDPNVAQKALYDIAEAIKSEIESSMAEKSNLDTKSEEDVEVERVERAATTPLDVFNIKVKSVMESEELDRRGKLQTCQDALSEVGEWMQKAIIQETPPSMGDIREVIVAAVNEGTRPLVQENATLKADLAEIRKQLQNQPVTEAPIRKSMYQTSGPAVAPKDKFSASEVARMTLPPGVIY